MLINDDVVIYALEKGRSYLLVNEKSGECSVEEYGPIHKANSLEELVAELENDIACYEKVKASVNHKTTHEIANSLILRRKKAISAAKKLMQRRGDSNDS